MFFHVSPILKCKTAACLSESLYCAPNYGQSPGLTHKPTIL